MSRTSPDDDRTIITKEKLQHDLATLESNATLLDAFLPPSLKYGSEYAQQSKSSVTLDNYSPNSSAPEDSVALSYSFVNATRNGALKLVTDGEDGVIGSLGEKIEHVRSDAEQMQKSLEGL
ncbi:hypothetical protein QFC21_001376 [Naganishia friedmannii]|uniref:Uncharacterized protein n=1 Tax=Naganishia friedmannii TaxID=89922 RepID=A0ACC2W6H9_9TREE|nr:hypothetical protein QFC21_001376 [Naganishia friedmannii]